MTTVTAAADGVDEIIVGKAAIREAVGAASDQVLWRWIRCEGLPVNTLGKEPTTTRSLLVAWVRAKAMEGRVAPDPIADLLA